MDITKKTKNVTNIENIERNPLEAFLKVTVPEEEEVRESEITLREVTLFNKTRTLKISYSSIHDWVYPKSVEQRAYQINITKNCLFFNTLVILPTGLGKTLIAASVMFNFSRWFRGSKVLFIAPTRPLVLQQLSAVKNTLKIHEERIKELLGTIAPAKRRLIWADPDSAFLFATPQTVKNDIENEVVDLRTISCLIIDEAHRAANSTQYSFIIDQLTKTNNVARVIGLTATPGNNIMQTQQIIDTLRISQLQIKGEEDLDVKQHTHEKLVEEIVVGEDERFGKVLQILKALIKSCLVGLKSKKVFWQTDPDSVKKFVLLHSMKQYTEANKGKVSPTIYWSVIGEFLLAISLVSARVSLRSYGIANCLKVQEKSFFQDKRNVKAKNMLKSHPTFVNLMKIVRQLDAEREEKNLDGPKIAKMIDIIKEHFSDSKNAASSKIIIFTSLRDSVTAIVKKIESLGMPELKPTKLIGQASLEDDKGLNQKQQKKVIADFQSNKQNILVATCIGEEGLDIGQVDLIINFDNVGSFVREIQRMGRTGRKRKGKCVSLILEEEKKLV